MLTFEEIRKNPEIKTYIERSNEVLGAVGFTEHGFPHALRTSDIASRILRELGYDARTCELAQIAGYMHDIGNLVNRHYHAQNGACLAFQILSRLGFSPDETAQIVSARVRNQETVSSDIHDRVNFAVQKAELKIDTEEKTIILRMKIDTEICAVMDYFEIFLDRMMLCKKSADYLGLKFELLINHSRLL